MRGVHELSAPAGGRREPPRRRSPCRSCTTYKSYGTRRTSRQCRWAAPPLHSLLPPAVPAGDRIMAGRDHDRWIADRMRHIESSGIRKVFDLARSLKDPVNLSIGQPRLRRARADQGRRPRRHRPRRQRLHRHAGHPRAARQDRRRRARAATATTTARSSSPAAPAAAWCSPCCCTVNPGDEVIVFDPYFVMYPHLVTLAGGTTVLRRHLSRLPHRRRPRPRRPDAAHQGHPRQQPRQPDRPRLRRATQLRDLAAAGPASATSCSSATRFTAPSATTARSPARRSSTTTCWSSTASARPTA